MLFLLVCKAVCVHWLAVIHDSTGSRVGPKGHGQALHTEHFLAIGSFMVQCLFLGGFADHILLGFDVHDLLVVILGHIDRKSVLVEMSF